MPVYTIASRKALTLETRQITANAITDTHCAVTGAPPEFVNIVFMQGHRIQGEHEIGVIGNVRQGGNRNKELTDDLRDRITHVVAKTTGLKVQRVLTTLIGFPASWAMEGGEILPEPGEEETWLQRTNTT